MFAMIDMIDMVMMNIIKNVYYVYDSAYVHNGDDNVIIDELIMFQMKIIK